MADPHKPTTGTSGAATTVDPNAPVKPKRGGARKLPDNVVQVKFLMPKDEHAILSQIADDDDRKPDDFARIIARKYVREHKNKLAATGNAAAT